MLTIAAKQQYMCTNSISGSGSTLMKNPTSNVLIDTFFFCAPMAADGRIPEQILTSMSDMRAGLHGFQKFSRFTYLHNLRLPHFAVRRHKLQVEEGSCAEGLGIRVPGLNKGSKGLRVKAATCHASRGSMRGAHQKDLKLSMIRHQPPRGCWTRAFASQKSSKMSQGLLNFLLNVP